MRVVISQDLSGLNNILAFIQEADLIQQQFSGKSKPTMWRLLIAFENFILQWEAIS
jgi:hypothetical protein